MENSVEEPQQSTNITARIFTGLAGAVIALLLCFVFLVLMTVTVIIGGMAQNNADQAVGCTPAGAKSADIVDAAANVAVDVQEEQIANAKAIDKTVKDLGLPGKASEIAIITAFGESTLINVDYGDQRNGVTNPDGTLATSYGLFQQQTSQGWGTKEEVMDPTHATQSFLLGPKHDGVGGLLSVEGWQDMEITVAIHKVQGNQDVNHYAASYAPAREVIKKAGIDITSGGDAQKMADLTKGEEGNGTTRAGTALTVNSDCSTSEAWDGDLGDGKWTSPLPGGTLTSAGAFGPRNIPGYPAWANNHRGVDLATRPAAYDLGGPVVAPADLEVLSIYEPDGCVQVRLKGTEGDPRFGMGFCHMGNIRVQAGDKLDRGDILGTEGNKGENLGNPQGGTGFISHLHLEVYPPDTSDEKIKIPNNDSAIDPQPIFEEMGAWE